MRRLIRAIAVLDGDARLSDDRNPNPHGHDAVDLAGVAAEVHGHDAADTTSGVFDIARLATGTPTGTKFVRDDGTLAVPSGGGGGATAVMVEVDFGATPIANGRFTLTDAGISPTSHVLCWQHPGPCTGKGTLADVAEADPVQVISVAPSTGTALVHWQTPPRSALIAKPGNGRASPIAQAGNAPIQSIFKRRGKVRGNFKFSYVVFGS